MKKNLVLALAGFAALSLAACSGKCDEGKCSANGCKDIDKVYSGVLPAADAEGMRYTLKLDYDDDAANKGDYDLVEAVVASDSTVYGGVKDVKHFKSEGDFTVVNGTGENVSKSYLKLVQDAKDSDPGSSGNLYFLVESDSTLVLVNDSFELPANPKDYTLYLVR